MQYFQIRLVLFLALIIISMFYGCWFTQQSQGMGSSNSARAELLLKGTYGIRPDEEPAATWIKDQATLNTLYQNLNARQSGKSVDIPQIDFNNFGILLLEMGQKPSGGYSLNFDPSKTRVDDGMLLVHVSWNVPADGMTVSQAVTSPFVLLKLNYLSISSILAVDQNSRSLFEIPIN